MISSSAPTSVVPPIANMAGTGTGIPPASPFQKGLVHDERQNGVLNEVGTLGLAEPTGQSQYSNRHETHSEADLYAARDAP